MTAADVTDKIMIVTGAASGIGAATARILAERGAKLVLVDRSADALEAMRAELEAAGCDCRAVTADVTDEQAVAGYVAQALEAYGRIDGFFNNAGIEGAITPATQLEKTDWDRVLAVNLSGAFLGLKHVVPVMEQQGSGSIVCTASIAAARGLPNTIAYNAAKHGVMGMVKTVAAESGPKGVRINGVMPGMIDTPMLHTITSKLSPDVDPAEGVKRIGAAVAPLGRTGRPEEIGLVVAFLLSDDARYVHGIGMPVDGGTLAVLSNSGE